MSNTHPREATLLTASKSSPRETFGNTDPWCEPSWYNSLNSPYYNDSHRKLRSYVRGVVDELLPDHLEWEAKGEVPRDVAKRYAAAGIAFADVPPPYRPKGFETVGGVRWEDLDVFHALIMTDEGSRMEGGVGIGLAGASVIGVPPIVHHGTEEQKKKWLPGLFTWETSFCLGITEPTGGSDVSNIRTTAKKSADGKSYIVNGHKKWITGAPWATHMTTAVRTGAEGLAGISLLVIELNSPGISIRKIENSGQNAGGASWVTMENVAVPAWNLIGVENAGFKYILKNFNKERYVMAVACNRKARTCLAHALAYSYERETFGAPLVANQIIRLKLITMAREVEAHFAWLEQIAYHIQTDPAGWQSADIAGRIALAKITGGRLQERAIREAQQVLGGVGYQKGGIGGHVEQQSRDVRMNVVGGGSEEILGDLAFREEAKRSIQLKKASKL